MAFLPLIDWIRTTIAWMLCQGMWKGTVTSEEDPMVGVRTRAVWGGTEEEDGKEREVTETAPGYGLVLERHSCCRKPRRKGKLAAVLLPTTSPLSSHVFS